MFDTDMSNVSRSVYQKLKEENKRLLKDIYILTKKNAGAPSFEKIETIKKWRDKFEKEEEFNTLLKELLTAKKP